jgi:uncharacterized integral membrane protein
MSRIKNVAVIVILVLALVVILQNTEKTTTRVLFVTIEMPRVLLLAIMVVIGVILGYVAAAKWSGRSTKQ